MHSVALLVAALTAAQEGSRIRFAPCADTKHHIAVQKESEHSQVVHFHLTVEKLAGKMAFARVRCAVRQGDDTIFHTSLKEVRVERDTEDWAFYLLTPRFPDLDPDNVVYQIEVGQIDPTEVDEYRVFESFAWQYRDNRMITGTRDTPISITIPYRAVVVEGGKFRLVTKTMTGAGGGDVALKYGLVPFPMPKNGTATAKRSQ